MANIAFKPKPQGGGGGFLNAIGGLLGGAIGLGLGGPAGAAQGFGIGSGIGGAADQLGASAQSKAPSSAPIETDQTAVGRRIKSISGDDLNVLKEGILALPEAPPEIRAQYAEPLLMAFESERKKRGIA